MAGTRRMTTKPVDIRIRCNESDWRQAKEYFTSQIRSLIAARKRSGFLNEREQIHLCWCWQKLQEARQKYWARKRYLRPNSHGDLPHR